jgi:hypothetical protein
MEKGICKGRQEVKGGLRCEKRFRWGVYKERGTKFTLVFEIIGFFTIWDLKLGIIILGCDWSLFESKLFLHQPRVIIPYRFDNPYFYVWVSHFFWGKYEPKPYLVFILANLIL